MVFFFSCMISSTTKAQRLAAFIVPFSLLTMLFYVWPGRRRFRHRIVHVRPATQHSPFPRSRERIRSRVVCPIARGTARILSFRCPSWRTITCSRMDLGDAWPPPFPVSRSPPRFPGSRYRNRSPESRGLVEATTSTRPSLQCVLYSYAVLTHQKKVCPYRGALVVFAIGRASDGSICYAICNDKRG